MKKTLMAMAAVALLTTVGCGDTATETHSETTSDSMAPSTGAGNTTGTNMETSGDPDPSGTYVDLASGKAVKLKRDSVSHYIVDESTSSPVSYYVNTATSDTFDRSGRVVNNALIKDANNMWSVDESRIKIKTQNDGDVKIKDRNTDTKVKLETNGDGKIKTDSGKIKVKDGEIKEKKN
ncbi:hypothetical protein EXU57_21635 [Segetibacter sp. 3557_3]|uniref:hypothetical protein n=1 Tax=Segetibacter sp. 3557_3 TaxID=2547429 RepID=UPI00105910F4|nr:hypothetical protein [Segetibacter sp. 3557_3]TDH20038.1 hypothetical protein EXU57_21635 [Segetibacter sp. 3557_3]